MSALLHALYRQLGPSGVESVDLLARDIADDCAVADVECHAYDTQRTTTGRIFQVTNPPPACSVLDAEQTAADAADLKRAVRYLILRGRIELVERRGTHWVRIVERAA